MASACSSESADRLAMVRFRTRLLSHSSGREAFLKVLTDAVSVELADAPDGPRSILLIADDKAGYAIVNDLRDGAPAKGDYRRSAGHRLNHDEPKWLRPIDGEQQRRRPSQQVPFGLVVELADQPDLPAVDQGLEAFLVVARLRERDFCCDAQLHSSRARQPDRGLRPLFPGQPPQKGKIGSGLGARRQRGRGHAMVDGAQPVCRWQWRPLVTRN
jgi:hypothetical protein